MKNDINLVHRVFYFERELRGQLMLFVSLLLLFVVVDTIFRACTVHLTLDVVGLVLKGEIHLTFKNRSFNKPTIILNVKKY